MLFIVITSEAFWIQDVERSSRFGCAGMTEETFSELSPRPNIPGRNSTESTDIGHGYSVPVHTYIPMRNGVCTSSNLP